MAAIEDIIITDQDGNSVFTKTPDGCNSCPNLNSTGGHHEIMTTTSSFSLSAGATYTFQVSTSNPNNSTLNSAVGVWIDFNGDEDFADADEFVSPANWTFARDQLVSFDFTVPCGGSDGVTRMRVRSNYYYYDWTANEHSTTGTQAYYGETEDYTCTYSVPAD